MPSNSNIHLDAAAVPDHLSDVDQDLVSGSVASGLSGSLCFRAPQYLQDLLTDGTPLQSLANESQEAVRRANEMLREMEILKTDIKTLLMVRI